MRLRASLSQYQPILRSVSAGVALTASSVHSCRNSSRSAATCRDMPIDAARGPIPSLSAESDSLFDTPEKIRAEFRAGAALETRGRSWPMLNERERPRDGLGAVGRGLERSPDRLGLLWPNSARNPARPHRDLRPHPHPSIFAGGSITFGRIGATASPSEFGCSGLPVPSTLLGGLCFRLGPVGGVAAALALSRCPNVGLSRTSLANHTPSCRD